LLSTLNALAYYLIVSKHKKNNYYVVFDGNTSRVYASCSEVTSIIKHLYYKEFDTLAEAFSVTIQQLGANYYVLLELRTWVKTIWDNNKVIFYNHCENQRTIIK
jgi:Caulimovirus viroplasmin